MVLSFRLTFGLTLFFGNTDLYTNSLSLVSTFLFVLLSFGYPTVYPFATFWDFTHSCLNCLNCILMYTF